MPQAEIRALQDVVGQLSSQYMLLPNYEYATIDSRKLRDYALNPNHPEGRHKARVFLSALGVTAADSEWLASALLQNLGSAEAVEVERTPWGTVYKVDLQIWKGSEYGQ